MQALRQQLQGPARQLASKRKASVLFDVPLGSSALDAGVGAGASAGINAAQPPPAPRFPQQSSKASASRDAAEAWVRQQLAAPGAPPLRALGWGSSEVMQVPHGFPRTGTRLFELLAELAPPLSRALWFLRVIALNRTRCGWTGQWGDGQAGGEAAQLVAERRWLLYRSAAVSEPMFCCVALCCAVLGDWQMRSLVHPSACCLQASWVGRGQRGAAAQQAAD